MDVQVIPPRFIRRDALTLDTVGRWQQVSSPAIPEPLKLPELNLVMGIRPKNLSGGRRTKQHVAASSFNINLPEAAR